MLLTYEDLTQKECGAAVKHEFELRTAMCELVGSSSQTTVGYTGSGREPKSETTGSFFTCDIPLRVNVMNKQINISLNSTIFIR
jgi:hypothetical protein